MDLFCGKVQGVGYNNNKMLSYAVLLMLSYAMSGAIKLCHMLC